MSSTILSTKILTPPQQELLLNAGLGFVHYNAISTKCLEFEMELNLDVYLFTSKNAVMCFLKRYPGDGHGQKVFCVGEKTAQLLTEKGFTVIAFAENAQKLANIISKAYRAYSFLFFSGSLRRDELPKSLKENNIRYKEVVVYETLLNIKKFERTFDGVLFFSPSGVQSFSVQNDLKHLWGFCIGETTAAEAKKYTNQITIANKPTVENVLVQAIKHFRSND